MCILHQLQTAHRVSPTFAGAFRIRLCCFLFFGIAISGFNRFSIQFHALKAFLFVSNLALQLVQRVDGAARVTRPAGGAVGPESEWLLFVDVAASVT